MEWEAKIRCKYAGFRIREAAYVATDCVTVTDSWIYPKCCRTCDVFVSTPSRRPKLLERSAGVPIAARHRICWLIT